MIKQYEVIIVSDTLAVIVDGLPTNKDPYLQHCKLYTEPTNDHGICDCKKVIATIGERIENIPLIELVDENVIWEQIDAEKTKPQEDTEVPLIISKMTHWNDSEWEYHEVGYFNDGKWCVGANMNFENNQDMHFVKYWLRRIPVAQSKYKYSEEDIRNAYQRGVARGSLGYDKVYEDKYIESLNKPKFPKVLELEMVDFCDYEGEEIWEITPDWRIKITNPQTNTIAPISVKY